MTEKITQKKTHQTDTDIIEMFHTFQEKVLNNKPPIQEMYDDLRMMNFKIKPLSGNIARLDLQNSDFVETLWSLGKLDEFFHRTVKTVPQNQMTMFNNLFRTMYAAYQHDLNKINIRPEQVQGSVRGFEMEIYKEKKKKMFN